MLLAVVVLILWRCKVWKSIRDLTVKMIRDVKFHPEPLFTVKSLIYIFELYIVIKVTSQLSAV